MQLSLALERPPFLTRVRALLFDRYGPQRDPERLDPIGQLILAMISARTRDEISLPAFARLQRSYPSWDLLRRARTAEIENVIRPVTFAERKATLLPRAIGMIAARAGRLNLDFLADWDEEAALQWLKSLPGVGAKASAAALNFSTLRKRVFVMDTRLLRLGARLGLLPQRADYDVGHAGFARMVPDDWESDDLYEFHWLMKYHGRDTCTLSEPDCTACPLRSLCPSAAMIDSLGPHQR
jgi:endonuclease-3